jgi:hypothetical protein
LAGELPPSIQIQIFGILVFVESCAERLQEPRLRSDN